MNETNEIKKILIFLIFIITGLSVFLINKCFIKSDYGIYNLKLYLTMISIQLFAYGFIILNKRKDKIEIKLDETNKNNFKYMKKKRKQEETAKRNKKKSIVYILLGNLTMIISNLYNYHENILSIFNILIVVFFILGIIKYEYKIELAIKEEIKEMKDRRTQKDDI